MTSITPTLAIMGLGGQEMVLVFLVVLLLFGAKKLPQLARGIGKSAGEFKRARAEFENEITRAESETAKSDEPVAKSKTEDSESDSDKT